jgi:hypothetical protein
MPTLDMMTTHYASTLVNNTDEPLAALAAQAAGTTVYGPFYNPKAALRLAVNITAVTGSLTVTILGYDQSSGATWTVLASTALSGPGLTLLSVGPYIAATANVQALAYAPVFYTVQCTIVTGPVTATIGAHGIGQ